jgi:hypothetical protein
LRIALSFGRFVFRLASRADAAGKQRGPRRPDQCDERRRPGDERSPLGGRAAAAQDAESANAPTEHAARNLVEIAPPRSSIGDDSDKEDAMKYMLLIHQGSTPTPRDPEAWARLSADEQQAVFADYKAINETPGVTAGLGLDAPETATTVRVEDGRTLTTDGPFVELKEAVGGWLIYEADNLDAAIELAARIPAARHGGAIEVRPVVEY